MRRPGHGKAAERKINVIVNAFTVMPPDMTIYHYDVKLLPEDAQRPVRLNRRIWQCLVTANSPFGRVAVAYDGRAMAYSPRRLPADQGQWSINLPEADGSTRRGNNFTIKISFIRPIQLGALRSFVSGNVTADEGTIMSCIQALNVVIQHGPMMVHPARGASFYIGDSPAQAKGFEMWKGYYSSLRCGIGGGFVNLDLAWQPFFKPGNLAAVLLELGRLDRASLTERDLAAIPPQPLIKLSRMVKGLRITLTVTGQDGRPVKRKIRALTSESAQDYHFDTENGRTNVRDYFLAAYGVRLVHPEWPCVLVSRTARYSIELCMVDVGQKYHPDLTPQQVSDVIKLTTIKPRERLAMLTRGIEAISPSNSQAFGQWQLNISRQPLQLQARVLKAPTISFAQNRSVVPQGGTWDLKGKRFIQPARLDNWIVFVFARESEFPLPAVRTSVDALIQQLKQLGVAVGPQKPAIHYGDVPPGAVRQFIRSKVNPAVPPQLLVCFLMQKPSPYYGQIKLLGDVQTGVATQCLNIPKARRNDRMYFANVALKVNVKLGGTNSHASLGKTVNVPTIVFGADVTHPGPGSMAPSVAAVVASIDSKITRYGTRMQTQRSRQEVIADLAEMVESLIRQFRAETKAVPQRLIFFRDGVSEGHYAQVLAHEVNAIRLACQRIDPAFKPALTFTVCGKRHHISIFPASRADSDGKTDNVPAGTTIDHTITNPFLFDWYTQSHGSLLGTSRSSHLTVLVDDSHFSPDDLQELAYNICYTFARSTRSVSLATPAYYADLVCTRAALYLANTGVSRLGTVHALQNNRLYFM
ncbi:hypothetical protein JCM10450v2_005107 [Rhodotorula kratochvilovae]